MTGLGQVGALGRLGSPALNNGGGDIITSIFADGTDGFYFDFSKTDRLFQSSVNNTPANDAGENIGLAFDAHGWAGREIAAEVLYLTNQITNGDNEASLMSTAYGTTTAVRGTVAQSADQAYSGTKSAKYLCNDATSNSHYITLGTIPANTALRISGRVHLPTGSLGKVAIVDTSDGSVIYTIASAVKDQWVEFDFTRGPKSGSWPLAIGNNTAESADGQAFYIDDLSIKEIPGNHGIQATTAAQPKWQTGGLARFDGSDDNLLTTLVPGTALTLAVKFNTPSATKILLGGGASAGDIRAYIGVSANGKASFGWGTDSLATAEYGADLRGGTHVMILTGSGATRELWVDGVQLTSGVSSGGSPNGGGALALGGWNNNGTLSNFAVGDIYYGLGIKKALPAATIAAITNLWGTS